MGGGKLLPLHKDVKHQTHSNLFAEPPFSRISRRRIRVFVLASTLLVWSLYFWHRLQGRSILHTANNGSHPNRHKFLTGRRAEKLFLSVPDEESCHSASKHYATSPHLAGSEGDLKTALYFLEHLQRELGIEAPQQAPIYAAGSAESRGATLSINHLRKPQAWVDIYYPVMNTPKYRGLHALDSLENVVWVADLEEHADWTDPEAGKYSESVPAFHGLSAPGDVIGKLIDVNYGLKEDYEALQAKGVDLTGAIVIARYGGNFRGLKIKAAEEAGAAGVLIYSDPRDDGTVTVEAGYEVYPYGPARNPNSVQRGSVQYLSMYPGDPTTPGYPAYANSTRTEGANIPKIPSLPISWNNAKKLLKELAGGWEGKLVRLINNVDTKVTPIWNVMGVIPGFIKDEVVVVGNHRDAWVMGTSDPSSGSASMHETIRGFGALLRKGWKPLRTIVIASWDAEEYGLIGSTEWGEDFAEWIDANVAAYLNLDVSVSGSRFGTAASPSLAHLVRDTAEDIVHPTDPNRSLWDARLDSGVLFGNNSAEFERIVQEEAERGAASDSPDVGALGSGSDFTVFLQRLGVASINHGFGQTKSDPVYHYHSVYDSERWMEIYGDPGFHRHVAIAKHIGLLTLRLADSVVLPINTTHYAFQLEEQLNKVQDIASTASVKVDLEPLRKSIRALQAASLSLDYEKFVAERQIRKIFKRWEKQDRKWRKLKRRARRAICGIRKRLGHPCKKHGHHTNCRSEEPPSEIHRNYSLDIVQGFRVHAPQSVYRGYRNRQMRSRLRATSEPAIWKRLSRFHTPWKVPFEELKKATHRVRSVNANLLAFERGFISEEGIPDREWYRHLGVAPGKWLGYGATTLPALTESITIEKNATLAAYEAERLRALIDHLADKIRVHA